jgi:phosphonate transport system substrate-binding protein
MFGVTALLWCLISGPGAVAQTAAPVKVKSMTLGLVSTTSQKEIEAHFQDFVRYVAAKVGAGAEGKVAIVPTPLQMAKFLEEKRVDFYMESPYPTYVINKQGAASLLLRRWKGGMAEYHGLIFSKKESEITRLEQLRGDMLAFEDPGSRSERIWILK